MTKIIEKVLKAYSDRNDPELSSALEEFHHQLIMSVYAVGPATMALELNSRPSLIAILNKVAAEGSTEPGKRLAFVAGFLSAYMNHLELVADRDNVAAVNAQLSEVQNRDDQSSLVHLIILKSCFVHAGTLTRELIDGVASFTKAKKNFVGSCIRELFEFGLLERIYQGRRVIAYRITRLGEAVLARRIKPHELALFFVDMAASDEKMRAAMTDEIKRTWKPENALGS